VYIIVKQYFYLVTVLIDGELTPLRIFLQYRLAIRFGRNYATKHPGALVGLHKQVISNNANITWICNLYPWETTTPDGDISPEEIVELCNMADADTDRLVSGHRVPNQQ
jgi:hypothetical protein